MRGNLSFCANGRQVASKNSDCKDTSNCLQNINIQNCSSGEKFSLFYPMTHTKSRQMKSKSMIEVSLKLSVRDFRYFMLRIFYPLTYEKSSNKEEIRDRAIIDAIDEVYYCL